MRFQTKFWLDDERAGESEVLDHIAHLKHQRLFAKTIRDGIRLVVDLRAGRVVVLCELFPWVLEQQLTHTQNGGPQVMSVPTFAAPPEDDDDEIVIKRDESTDSAHTFLKTLNALVE